MEDSLQFLAKHIVCSSVLPSAHPGGYLQGSCLFHLEPGNFPPAWGISTVQQLGIERFL